MSIQGLKITKDQIHYIFPKQIKNLYQCIQRNQLKKKLKQQFKQYSYFLPNFPYSPSTDSSGATFILQCNYCANKLQYNFNIQKGIFQLNRFSVDHIHGLNVDSQEIKSNEKIQQLLINTYQIQQKIKQKIQKLTQPIAKHFNVRQQKKNYTFQNLIDTLTQQKCFYSYQPLNYKQKNLTFPDYLLIISQEMKKAYCQYGRSVGLDFTYNLIKQTPLSKNNNSQYLVGFIVGLNSYRRINIFAIVIATQENSYFVQKTFTQFIKYMGKQPDSIVTDQSIGVLAGMRRIKQSGVYRNNSYWDTFHALKTYKFRHRKLKTHMRKMIKIKCKYQFQKMYLEAVTMARTQGQMDSVHKFMHQSNKYCISQIQPNFIGLGVSDSQNQSINNLIKIQLAHQKGYTEVVRRIITIIEQRNSLSQALIRQYCRVQQTIQRNQLRIVRHSLCRKVFNFLFAQIMNCYKVNLVYSDIKQNDYYCISNQNAVHFVKRAVVDNNKQNISKNKGIHIKQQFKCTCKFQEKTGIPCEHIIKIIILSDNNFMDRIDQYWVVEDPDRLVPCVASRNDKKQQHVKKRGRPTGRRPLLYLKPVQQAQKSLPPSLDTFRPIKCRRTYQAMYDKRQKQKPQKFQNYQQQKQITQKNLYEIKQQNMQIFKDNQIKQRSKLIKGYYATSKL